MLRLKVENFSCIRKADLEFGRLTVLIGPQASGKSLLAKLAYFFIELLTDQYDHVVREKSFEDYAEEVKTRFCKWFPTTAWGTGKFKIEFDIGDYRLRLSRMSQGESVGNTLRLWASPLAKEHYQELRTLFDSLQGKDSKRRDAPLDGLTVRSTLVDASRSALRRRLAGDFIEQQTFIPAGRSFFTSLGRAFMAFEQGSTLDPATIRFGRYYSYFYESIGHPGRHHRFGTEPEIASILGGVIDKEGDTAVVKSPDGRVVPFSVLSSGQQEVLPLALVLSAYGALWMREPGASNMIYVEEPEAHLFPDAQSRIVEWFAAITGEPKSDRRFVLTTHSPYVLSKINNLVKAGMLAEEMSAKNRKALDEIVPAKYRLRPGSVAAYSLVDGVLNSIVSDGGLIDATYLDSVSGDIGEEFDQLLELECTV